MNGQSHHDGKHKVGRSSVERNESLTRLAVVERIFEHLLVPGEEKLTRRNVTSEDIRSAVRSIEEERRSDLSDEVLRKLGSPFTAEEELKEFFKPAFKRGSRPAVWPERLQRARIEARVRAIPLEVFRFTDYWQDQQEPFPKNRGRSEKPPVIEWIFDQLLDPVTSELTRTLVTNDLVLKGIEWGNDVLGLELSKANPANFMKDVIRGKGANGMWPKRLHAERWTALQVTGDGKVFEFVRYEEDQTEPFPNRFGYHDGVVRHRIQSVSMPLASKDLGRDDETYLIQVAVKLAVVETHFALHSPLNIVELNHLQIGIKLRLCELDALFAAYYTDSEGETRRLVITAEAKKRGQRILEEQVIRQVRAAFAETDVGLVVPIVMTVAEGGIYVAEFKAVRREDEPTFDALELETDALYELVPSVKGI